MKKVIIFPRFQLTAKDKERLSKAGYIAIEVDEPSAVNLLEPKDKELFDKLLVAFTENHHLGCFQKIASWLADRDAKRIISQEVGA